MATFKSTSPLSTAQGIYIFYFIQGVTGTFPSLPPPLGSENELTSYSLQVMHATGSPGRTLLAVLADRSCTLDFLIRCLKKMGNQEAVQYLSTTGNAEAICVHNSSLFLIFQEVPLYFAGDILENLLNCTKRPLILKHLHIALTLHVFCQWQR